MNTGELIKLHRKKKGFSTSDLAKAVGVSKQSISLYERCLRTPSIVNAMKICSTLGIDFDELNATLPESQALPLDIEVDKNPELAINIQTEIYVDEQDRKYILFMSKLLSYFNYDVTISKKTVIIENLQQELNEPTIYLDLTEFTTLSSTLYLMFFSLLESLKTKSRK